MGWISKKAVRNTTYIALNWILQNALGFLFWIVFAKILAPNELGWVSAVLNFGIFLSTFALLGLPPACTKLIPELRGKGMEEEIKALNAFVFRVVAFLVLVISFAILLFAEPVSHLAGLDRLQLLLSVLVFASISFLYLSGSVAYALEKLNEFLMGNVIYSALKLVLPLCALLLGLSYKWLIPCICAAAILAVMCRLKAIKFGKGRVDRERVKLFALSSFIGGMAGALYNQGGVLITNALSSAFATGVFTLAFMLSMPLRSVPAVLGSAISPLESEAWSKGEKQKVKEMISRTLKYSYMICIPLLVIFLVFSKEILLIAGSYRYLAGTNAMRLIVLGVTLSGLGSVLSGSLYYVGKPLLARNLSILLGALVFLLGAPLTALYGINGISLAYFIAGIIFALISAQMARKEIGISFEKRYLLLCLVSSLALLPVICALRIWQPNIFGIACSGAGFAAGYGYLLLRSGFFDSRDLALLRLLARKLPRGARKNLKRIENFLKRYAE